MTAGLITTSDGYRYELTPTDLLWAARMLVGESGTNTRDGAGVLWTMASRLAQQRGTSFTDVIRNYSQPINPRWGSSGDMCGPGGRYAGQDNCSDRLLQRRAQISGLQPEDMPTQWSLVQRWAAGQVPNPVPRAVEFATPEMVASCVAGAHGDCSSLIGVISNAFASSSRSDTWPANYVSVGGASDGASSVWMGLAIGGGIALAAGVVAWVVSEEYGV